MTETHAASHEDLFAAEADYWQKRAQRAEEALSDLTTAALTARHPALDTPPQPPVGTSLHRSGDDAMVWERRADGWHCGLRRDGCPNCPCDWFEVVEQGGLDHRRRLP